MNTARDSHMDVVVSDALGAVAQELNLIWLVADIISHIYDQ